MQKAVIAVAFATMLFLFFTYFAYGDAQVGIKVGDWVECEYASSGNPPENAPQWIKIECLSLVGTTATLRVTSRLGNGAERIEIMTLDVASGAGNITFQALIPANSKTGDTIKAVGGVSVTIAGEKTETYAKASRTVVYTSFTQDEKQFTYHWDKQTGMVLEVTLAQGSSSFTYEATSTNLWQSSSIVPSLPAFNISVELLSLGISVTAAIVIIATALVYSKHKRS